MSDAVSMMACESEQSLVTQSGSSDITLNSPEECKHYFGNLLKSCKQPKFSEHIELDDLTANERTVLEDIQKKRNVAYAKLNAFIFDFFCEMMYYLSWLIQLVDNQQPFYKYYKETFVNLRSSFLQKN